MLNPTRRAKQWRQFADALVVLRRTDTKRYCFPHPGYNAGYVESYSYSVPLSPLFDKNVEPNWALALRLKIIDDKVSFADAIGEWRESAKLLSDAAGVFKRAFRVMKTTWRLRKNRRALRWWFRTQFGRDPANKFELYDAVQVDLLIKFGIKPLAQQAWDSVEQLNKVLQRLRRVQVTLKSSDKTTQAGQFGGEYKAIRERSYRAIAWVRYDMDSREFTAGNLGEALWAGTRLSFMVDWFWNFGSYLSSLNAMGGVTSFKGVLCKREQINGTDKRITLSGGRVVTPGRYVYQSYERVVLDKLPLGSLPGVNLPRDEYGKLMSAMEVFWSLRRASQAR